MATRSPSRPSNKDSAKTSKIAITTGSNHEQHSVGAGKRKCHVSLTFVGL